MPHIWRNNESSDLPYYAQIASIIKEQIKQGYLPAGSKLSERKLATAYKVSRTTITRALDILREEGIIESAPKSVTIVAKDAWYSLAKNAPDWHKLASRGSHLENNEIAKSSIIKNLQGNTASISLIRLNQQEFPINDFIKDAVSRTIKNEKFDNVYSDMYISGFPDLKDAVSDYLGEYGIKTSGKSIGIFYNWHSALNCISNALFSSSTLILHMRHDLISCFHTVSSTGAELCPLDFDDEGILTEALKNAIRKSPTKDKILYIQPVNHIPTGLTTSQKRLDEILEICQSIRLPVIENDINRDIWTLPPPMPLKSRDKYDQIIYFSNMSCSWDIGVRTNWAILPESVYFRILDVKSQLCGGSNIILNFIAYEMLSKGIYKSYMEKVRDTIFKRSIKLKEILHTYLDGAASWDDKNISACLWIKLKNEIAVDKIVKTFNETHIVNGKVFSGTLPGYIYMNPNDKPIDDVARIISEIANIIK